MRYLIRTLAVPADLLPQLKQIIQKSNPEISVERVETMPNLIGESIWRRRLWGAMLSVFAGLALLLASIGLYGVMSYIVAQQQKEIGIRLAIGAEPALIVRWVLRRGMLLAGTGIAIGLLVALVSSSYLGSLLFEISGQDTTAFVSVAGILLLVAFVACAIPALRATRIDPVIALRQE
ncbi:MAG: FtsX-like permease family protein [Bryobacteraceae bacterium]